MHISLDSFRQFVGADATRIKLNENANGVIATGATTGGRVVAWLQEAFGQGKADNQAAIRQFVATIRNELGEAAGNTAELSLQARLQEGRPLSARTVGLVIRNAESLVLAHQEQHAEQLQEQRAEQLSDLSDKSTAHTMIMQRVDDGRIPQEVAQIMLSTQSPALQSDIRDAVLRAGPNPINQENATAQVIETTARRIEAGLKAEALFAPGPNETPSTAFQIVGETLGHLGLDVDRVLSQLQPNQISDATTRLAARIEEMTKNQIKLEGDDLKSVVNMVLRDALSNIILQQLNPGDQHAQSLVADLKLDHALNKASSEGRLLTTISDQIFKGEQASVKPIWAGALLRGANQLAHVENHHQALQRTLDESYGFSDNAFYQALDPDQRITLLNLKTTLATSAMERAIKANGNGDNDRHNAVHALADRVNIQIEMIKKQAGISEVRAIEYLKQNEPELIAQMDRLLANGGDNPAPGAWLENRKALAQLRERTTELAMLTDGGKLVASGNDLQRLVTAGLRDMAAKMFENAALTLGPPPGPFTVIALGSTARGEASPFSDIEFGILLPDDHTNADREYAIKLSALVREQVIALGETGSKERGDGFHWDVMNNPVNQPDQFIGSAKQLIANNSDGFNQTIFTNTEWLFGNDVLPDKEGKRPEPDDSWTRLQGPQGLHREVQNHMRSPAPNYQGNAPVLGKDNKGAEVGQWMIKDAVGLARKGLEALEQNQVDVKRLARLPMLVVQGLALQHGIVVNNQGIATNSTHLRLEALVEKGVLSRTDANLILDLQDSLSAVRVRSHLYAGTAEDNVRIDEPRDPPSGLFHAPELADLIAPLRGLIERAERYTTNLSQPF